MSHLSAPVPVALRFVERSAAESASRRFIGRAAGVYDAKALAALQTALSTEAEHMVFDVADPRALVRRCLSELRASKLGERGIFVVETAHDLVGYVDIRQILKEGAGEFASFDLAIRKQYWGNGPGSRLVALAEQWAEERKLRFIIISVSTQNVRARALYARLGYSICDTVRAGDKGKVTVMEAYIMGRMIIKADRPPPKSILEVRDPVALLDHGRLLLTGCSQLC
jgi:ribosomal protein S18 acetylase RimI-like enzyme